MASHLLQSAQALRLMGAEALFTGISAELAQTLTTLGVPCPERNVALFVSINGTFRLQAHDLETREARGSHRLPESVYPPERLLRWGDRWYADGKGPPLLLTHGPCGRDLELRPACSHCGEALDSTNTGIV